MLKCFVVNLFSRTTVYSGVAKRCQFVHLVKLSKGSISEIAQCILSEPGNAVQFRRSARRSRDNIPCSAPGFFKNWFIWLDRDTVVALKRAGLAEWDTMFCQELVDGQILSGVILW